MIQLNDLHQSTVDASKIVDITSGLVRVSDKTCVCSYLYTLRCKLIDENIVSFIYGLNHVLYADYQQLLTAKNA